MLLISSKYILDRETGDDSGNTKTKLYPRTKALTNGIVYLATTGKV